MLQQCMVLSTVLKTQSTHRLDCTRGLRLDCTRGLYDWTVREDYDWTVREDYDWTVREDCTIGLYARTVRLDCTRGLRLDCTRGLRLDCTRGLRLDSTSFDHQDRTAHLNVYAAARCGSKHCPNTGCRTLPNVRNSSSDKMVHWELMEIQSLVGHLIQVKLINQFVY